MSVTTYDTESYELAKHFLNDDPRWLKLNTHDRERTLDELARDIQQAVEDYCGWLDDGRSR